MYEGTLAGHWQAIVTMQQMIVLATPEGIVDMTPDAIARRTTIPLKIIEAGLKKLAEPDPLTRTPGEDGRRIVLLDEHRPWGWRLVNHAKYRALRNLEQKREADRERQADKRKKNKDVAIGSQGVAEVAHTDTDTDTDTDTKKEQGAQRSPNGSRLPSEWQPSEVLRAWAAKERPDLSLDVTLEKFRDYWLGIPGAKGRKLDWEATFRNWVRGEKPGNSSKQIDFDALARRIEEEDRRRAADG